MTIIVIHTQICIFKFSHHRPPSPPSPPFPSPPPNISMQILSPIVCSDLELLSFVCLVVAGSATPPTGCSWIIVGLSIWIYQWSPLIFFVHNQIDVFLLWLDRYEDYGGGLGGTNGSNVISNPLNTDTGDHHLASSTRISSHPGGGSASRNNLLPNGTSSPNDNGGYLLDLSSIVDRQNYIWRKVKLLAFKLILNLKTCFFVWFFFESHFL